MHGVDEGWQWAGKQPIPAEAEEFIRSDWADRMAHGAAQNPDWWDYVEDLAQEARISMWSEALKWDGTGDVKGFLAQRGRWRVWAIIRGRQQFTGHVRVETRGLARDVDENGKKTVPTIRKRSLDELHEALGFEVVDADDHLAKVLVRYHDGEVAQAISELPPKWQEYVRLKYWDGLSEREIAALVGDNRKYWRTTIAPRLAQRLRHLVEA